MAGSKLPKTEEWKAEKIVAPDFLATLAGLLSNCLGVN